MCSFTSVDEVAKRCDELSIEESRLQSELEALLQFDDLLESCVKRLNKKMPNVEYLSSDSHQLSERINFTSALSQNVSCKVRKLDLAKSRVTKCLQRVGDILDLKYCVDGIHKSLINEDYEHGAAYIHRFLSIDVSVLRNSTDDEIYTNDEKSEMFSSSMNEAFAKFYEAKDKLQDIVRRKFDEAVKDDDVASVERFFKIFPLLNESEEGLNKYANYLAKKIEDRIVRDVSSAETHVAQLTSLFEGIARIIDIHEPLIETYYGHGKLIVVIEVLQKECDRKAIRIINDFKLCKNFNSIITSITKSMKASSSANNNKVDPREIDQLLPEVMLVACRAGKYFKFVSERARKDIEISLNENHIEREAKLNRVKGLIRNCDLSHAIEEMNGIYVFLEEYFLKESCLKAMQIDDIDSAGTLTSSLLDDVFFIVNKCIKRSLSGRNMDVLCAIINHSVSILDASFCDLANERLRYGYPSAATITGVAAALDLTQAYNVIQTGRYLQSYSDVEKTKVLFLVTLNNLDAASDYINSFKKNINRDVNKMMEAGTQRQQMQKFQSCLEDLSSLTNKFQGIIVSGLNQLASSVLKSKIKMWTDAFIASPQILSEEEFLRYEISSGLRPFTESFLVSVDTVLKSFKQSLTPNNYTNLINAFATDLIQRFESAISKCQFNKIGGHQLDRELRAIISYLTSLTTWSLRDKFSRLKDITFILSVESLTEINEYFKDGNASVGSRLTRNEIRVYLKQRVEFSNDEVRRIL